jgi:hypothetical protein
MRQVGERGKLHEREPAGEPQGTDAPADSLGLAVECSFERSNDVLLVPD